MHEFVASRDLSNLFSLYDECCLSCLSCRLNATLWIALFLLYLLFPFYLGCRLVLRADGADALGQGGVAVAEPHHQRVGREVAQTVAGQLLEALHVQRRRVLYTIH